MPKLCGVMPAIRDRTKRVVYLIVCRKCGLIHIGINKDRSAMHRWGLGLSDIGQHAYAGQNDWYKFNPEHLRCTFDIYWYEVEEKDQSKIEKVLQEWAEKKKLSPVNGHCKAKAKSICEKFESESAVDLVLCKRKG